MVDSWIQACYTLATCVARPRINHFFTLWCYLHYKYLDTLHGVKGTPLPWSVRISSECLSLTDKPDRRTDGRPREKRGNQIMEYRLITLLREKWASIVCLSARKKKEMAESKLTEHSSSIHGTRRGGWDCKWETSRRGEGIEPLSVTRWRRVP